VEQHVQHFGKLCSQLVLDWFSGFCSQPHLQLIGQTTIQWNLDDPIHSTGGTHRYWDFEIKEWLETDLLKPLHWEFFDYSLTILPQGNYKDLG